MIPDTGSATCLRVEIARVSQKAFDRAERLWQVADLVQHRLHLLLVVGANLNRYRSGA